ncbi:uncharacterized protein LAJ45_08816 [Morchella importuna]|uniref:uncharacterized protein n=1 Tax=Morchella importuna TaxID=1174673 RepID=UPI001E8D1839|nr:uncharacterized protein LAJ45_08816 [Morchella importuna]KAH8147017.1 hypothetical protein LAJ45_08816 [Morchella importuna]
MVYHPSFEFTFFPSILPKSNPSVPSSSPFPSLLPTLTISPLPPAPLPPPLPPPFPFPATNPVFAFTAGSSPSIHAKLLCASDDRGLCVRKSGSELFLKLVLTKPPGGELGVFTIVDDAADIGDAGFSGDIAAAADDDLLNPGGGCLADTGVPGAIVSNSSGPTTFVLSAKHALTPFNLSIALALSTAPSGSCSSASMTAPSAFSSSLLRSSSCFTPYSPPPTAPAAAAGSPARSS